jgi:hypothetical protein
LPLSRNAQKVPKGAHLLSKFQFAGGAPGAEGREVRRVGGPGGAWGARRLPAARPSVIGYSFMFSCAAPCGLCGTTVPPSSSACVCPGGQFPLPQFQLPRSFANDANALGAGFLCPLWFKIGRRESRSPPPGCSMSSNAPPWNKRVPPSWL